MRISVLLVVLLAGTAHADDREDARREFAAGQASDKAKDWQEAIVHYLRANDLVPHEFAMFNIAVDYERIGKLRESAKWYERYLQAAPQSPDRAKVTQLLVDLKTRPSSLSVRTLPDGARVTIDGSAAGATPFATKLRGGTHHVSVDRESQHDERDVELEYGEPADVVFTLGGGDAGGTLYVTGAPFGAYVAVDDVPIGSIPASTVVSPGKHEVRVTAYGYTTFDTWTVVTSGQPARVEAVLTRALGMIDPPGPKLQIGYLIGASIGADVTSGSALGLAEFGARLSRYEGLVRVGRQGGTAAVDFVIRFAFFDKWLSPMFGAGYAYASNGFGYETCGGLRWDLSRSEHLGFSLVGDFGVRWTSGTDAMGVATSGLSYPLELSAEVIYR